MLKVQRNSKGFTLIELLIVIAIIGILAAIAIPAYTGYTKKSKFAGVVNGMGALKNAVAAYFTEKGTLEGIDVEGIENIANSFSITLPSQYINTTGTTVVGDNEIAVTITANVTGIGTDVNGKTLTLSTTNIEKGEQWSWGGDVPDAYKPK